ncbi:hypothetical protein [uncultured Algibacter sp.]|uniref:hypothetical protein n=1 Tax=uncultured Algibacter sp. TaxID=298659 RepID=UPI002638489D|nr:hypothetical protein [uncultured Algibacter sp.]
MNDFLLEYKNTITFSVEILASVTGLLLYKKYKSTDVKFFIWFLVYLTVCDTLGNYTEYIHDGGILNFLEGSIIDQSYCYWWYTTFWKIGAIMFFAFYYRKILEKKLFKKIIQICSYIFLTFSIIFIVLNWDDFFNKFFPAISVLGAVIIFLCTVFYFIEILQSEKILTFYKSINFYVSTAIFIWWLVVTPLVFYDIYMSNADWNFIFLRWQIYLFVNILMYSTFTFALIFCKPEKTVIN